MRQNRFARTHGKGDAVIDLVVQQKLAIAKQIHIRHRCAVAGHAEIQIVHIALHCEVDADAARPDRNLGALGNRDNAVERARNREPEKMSPRQAWRAIQAGLPKEAIISTDIGNNCAIGNAYPTFEAGRKYLAPGLFGPCGYGFPAILGARIGCPDTPVVGFAGAAVGREEIGHALHVLLGTPGGEAGLRSRRKA